MPPYNYGVETLCCVHQKTVADKYTYETAAENVVCQFTVIQTLLWQDNLQSWSTEKATKHLLVPVQWLLIRNSHCYMTLRTHRLQAAVPLKFTA